MKSDRSWRNYISGACSLLLGILVWWTVARIIGTGNVFLPTPASSIITLIRLCQSDGFSSDIGWSVMRVTSGAMAGLITAVPLGLWIAMNHTASWFLEPLIRAVRFVPLSAFIPISFLLIGTNEPQKVAVLFVTAFLYILPTTIDTARNVERNYIDVGRMCGLGRLELTTKVIWPRISPRVLDSFRAALSIGWSYVLVVEITGATTGIGHTMSLGQRYIQPAVVFAGVVAVSALGIIFDYSLKGVGRTLFGWEQTLAMAK